MTKEYAALLAQVIPVVALAVAIEGRTLAARYIEFRRNPEEKSEGEGHAAFLFMMVLIQVVLAIGEVKVLTVAGGGSSSSSNDPLPDALNFGIILAFLVPAGDSLLRVLYAMNSDRARPGRRVYWVAGVIVVLIALAQAANVLMS